MENDQKVRLMAATLEIGIERVDGQGDTTIVVKTTNKIWGGMKPTDWVTMKQQWNHRRRELLTFFSDRIIIT